MKYLVNFKSADGFIEAGTAFKGNKTLEKKLLERGVIGQEEKEVKALKEDKDD